MQTITKKEEEGDEVTKPEPMHEGLWIITPFSEADYWFLRPGKFILLIKKRFTHVSINSHNS